MNNYLRTSSITRVMEAMRATAPRFEEFGGRLMDYVLTVPLLHRGVNVLGHSVGYTVDSYTDKGRVVAQYSAEKGYFRGIAKKPFEDILHALRMKNETEHVFLVALDDWEPKEEEELRKRLVDLPGFNGRTFHFYNRRRIAEYIVDNLLLVDQAVDSLAHYLPRLREISDEHSANLLMPSVALNYKYRAEVDQAISERLVAEKCLVLCGVGGIGKSQAAAAFAKAKFSEFELVIWTDGASLKDLTDLHSLAVGRAGVRRNVASLLQMRHCLLVVDDLSSRIERERFAELCGEWSRVVITQREKAKNGFDVPLMVEGLAKDLLTEGLVEKIDTDVWKKLFTTVGGHPLSLGLMNAAAKDGASWADLVDDCQSVGEFVDDSRGRLVDRLLKRFQESLNVELGAIKWLNSKESYRPLLKALIAPVGVRKIEAHSLAAPSRQSVLRLHDVIFSALNSARWIRQANDGAFEEELDIFLTAAAQSTTVDLKAAALLHRDKLQELLQQGRGRPSFVYAMLQTWRPDELDRRIVGEPSDVLTRLEQAIRPAQHIETAVVLESIESFYRADKELDRKRDKGKAKVAGHNLALRLGLYDRLTALPGLTTLQQAEILHHKGKALALTDDAEKAKQCFEAVLAGRHPMYESQLQLVKVLKRLNKRSEAIAQADMVLTAAKNPNVVSTSVALATICAVPSGQERDALMATHADVLEREILVAADAAMGQAFETLVAVSRSWRYGDPRRLLAVWSAVELPNPDDDRTRATLAELFQNVAHVQPIQKSHLLEKAMALYSDIREWEDFWLQQYAEALIAHGKYPESLVALDSMEKQNPWAHYNRSKAFLRTGNISEASHFINLAINGLPSENANFRARFLALRFKIRLAAKDVEAATDLKDAIKESTTDQYRERLLEQLENYTGKAFGTGPPA